MAYRLTLTEAQVAALSKAVALNITEREAVADAQSLSVLIPLRNLLADPAALAEPAVPEHAPKKSARKG